MNYKVLIPTSGVGSKIGLTSEYTNKALAKVGDKPVISHIIDSYPANTQFIITLGHFADHVRGYLEIAHPKSKIEYVTVDKFEGKGSSQLYSLYCAHLKLDCPFVYHACDTMLQEVVTESKVNWCGGARGEGSSQYASFNTIDHTITKANQKGELNPDYLYIGLMGVNDYKNFWKLTKSILKSKNQSPNDIDVINAMLAKGKKFKISEVNEWQDTGNADGLNLARKKFPSSADILEKSGESIFFLKSGVCKFFDDINFVENRVKRATILKPLTPKIIAHNEHFYLYDYVDGKILSEAVNVPTFKKLLEWADKKLWIDSNETNEQDFYDRCYDFYYKKTLKRIKKLVDSGEISNSDMTINGINIPSVEKILSLVDWKRICKAKQTHFHGDFILDNILKTKRDFCLLDWRQDFGGLLESGDMYYDLAKLNHNLTINHHIVNNSNFEVNISGKSIKIDIHRKNVLVECQQLLKEHVIRNHLDEYKFNVLTPIIWLNMSPLHHHPFNIFLFYFGLYNLWLEIQKKY